MKTISIQYIFTLNESKKEYFNLKMNAKSLGLVNDPPEVSPFWTELDYEKCPHCTLDSSKVKFCPLSIRLVDIVDRFQKIISCDKLHLEVHTNERIIHKNTTAQKGLSSLMGLIIATSNCPHTLFLKPMARFHLPLASKEETVYRATSMYLLSQYFLKKEGLHSDMELAELSSMYKNIELMNLCISKRLQSACKTDVALNALTLLDTFSKTLTFIIGGSLEQIKYLFKPYFEKETVAI